MTQLQISRIFFSLNKLSDCKLPVKKAYDIYKLLNILKPQIEFCTQEEKKIINSYGGNISNDGSINFSGVNKEESAQKCFLELNRLHDLDVDINIIPIIMSFDDMKNQNITPTDIYNLEGVVEFVQEESQ